MPLPIPADVFCSYNSVTFPSNIRTKAILTPVTSGDNRTVKCTRLKVQVSGFLTQADADAMDGAVAGASLNAVMLSIRRKLSVHGKQFRFDGKGLGDLNINDPGGQGIRDVWSGPKPGDFVWVPLGGQDGAHGAMFEWSIETHIAECGNFSNNPGPRVFLEISFTVNYDVGEDGLVVITYRGNAQIPLSLRANNTILRSVDESIEAIIRPIPDGFLRHVSRQLSGDRAVCQFTIVDREVEIPQPDDTISIDMHHRIRQERPYSPIWSCTISGTLRMSPTANKYLAWVRFFNIAAQRMAWARSHAVLGLANGLVGAVSGFGATNGSRGIVLGTIEMDENLFKNESSFSISFRMLGAPLEAVVRVSGLWRPIVNNNLGIPPGGTTISSQTWAQSLSGNAQKTKGILGASFAAADDVIIDICSGEVRDGQGVAAPPQVLLAPDDIAVNSASNSDDDLLAVEPSGLAGTGDLTKSFPPETSWLAWQCTVERDTNHHQIRHKPLAGLVKTDSPASDPFDGQETAANVSPASAGFSTDTPDIIQQTCSPSMIIRLRGGGVRVAHRVNPPKMLSYGGKTVVLQHEQVSEAEIGLADGISMFRTDWVLTYIIASPPSTFPLPANPMLGSEGDDGDGE